jgi:hypothetical protein
MNEKKIFKRFLKEIGLYSEFLKCAKTRCNKDFPDPFDITYRFEPDSIIMCAFGWDESDFKGWSEIYQYLVTHCKEYEHLLDDEIITGICNIVQKYDKQTNKAF